MKTLCKTLFLFFLALSLTFSFSGCFVWNSGTPEKSHASIEEYRLIADFSNGFLDGEMKFLDKPITCGYYDKGKKENVYTEEAYEAAAVEIADYLSEWVGLDFTLNNAKVVENGILIDWSEQSTLLAGLDDREQKRDFTFYDAVSLNWFMMDSLAATLIENLPINAVYYCCNGQALEFTNPEDMAAQGLTELSADKQYYGSYYYVSETD